MSLLTIAQNIAKDTKDGQVPSSIVGNNSATALQLFSAIRRATKYITRRHDWQALTAEYTFKTEINTPSYSLPNDILQNKIINNSIYNFSTKYKLDGPISDASYQFLTRGFAGVVGIVSYWQIRQRSFFILPVPTTIQEISYKYIQNTPILNSTTNKLQNDWQNDSDTCIIDEFLIELEAKWRYLQFKGRPYQEEKLEATEELNSSIASDKAPGDVYMNTTSPLADRGIGSNYSILPIVPPT